MTPELLKAVSDTAPIFGPILTVLTVAIGFLATWLREAHAGRVADAKEYAASVVRLTELQVNATKDATAAVVALRGEVEDLQGTRRKSR